MGHTALAPRSPQERNPSHNNLILPVAPADWEAGSGLQLDRDQLRSQLVALRFSHLGADLREVCEAETHPSAVPTAEQDDTPAFPVWLWELRADSIRNAVPFFLESRSPFFWHQVYLENIAPRVNALLAWCTGENRP
jgi:hypothetical protein